MMPKGKHGNSFCLNESPFFTTALEGHSYSAVLVALTLLVAFLLGFNSTCNKHRQNFSIT